MKKIFSIVIMLLLTASISYSAPTPTINYLMNEPVSLLDWGMYNLNKKFKEMEIVLITDRKKQTIKKRKLRTVAVFEFDKNSIIIRSHLDRPYIPVNGVEEAKKICKEIVKKIRAELSIDQENPKVDFSSKFVLELLFSHSGYIKSNQPKNLAEELLNIMEINSTISYMGKTDDKTGSAPYVNCKTPLMSNESYYSE